MSEKPKLPGLLIAVAIMNLVLGLPCGGFALIGAIYGGVKAGKEIPEPKAQSTVKAGGFQTTTPKNQTQIEDEMMVIMRKDCPGYHLVTILLAVGQSFVGLLLILGGAFLLMGKPMGRLVTYLACGLLIVITIVNAGYSAAFVFPAQQKWMDMNAAALPPGFAGIMQVTLYATLLLNVAIGIGYPILAFILLSNHKVKAFYANKSGSGLSDDTYNTRLEDDKDERWGS
jgi:hypothetical protein